MKPNEKQARELRIVWPTLSDEKQFIHSQQHFTIQGCINSEYWLQLNSVLLETWLIKHCEIEHLPIMCERVSINYNAIYCDTDGTALSEIKNKQDAVECLVAELKAHQLMTRFVDHIAENFVDWISHILIPKRTVFISHTKRNKDDEKFSKVLRDDLITSGYGVWFDEDIISVGDSIPEGISDGIANADFFLMVLSPEYLSSPWVKREIWSAVNRLIDDPSRLIPCMRSECQVPVFLADLKYANFTDSYRSGLKEVLKALEGHDTN